jgi:hypothetical protein
LVDKWMSHIFKTSGGYRVIGLDYFKSSFLWDRSGILVIRHCRYGYLDRRLVILIAL